MADMNQTPFAPQTPQGQPEAQQPSVAASAQKKSKAPLIIVLVLVVIALVACIIGFVTCSGGSNSFFDSQAQTGQAPYKSEEEIQAELNRQVEEGMFNISIASVIEFENGTAPGTAYIENIPGNNYNMTVEITLDENGEPVYQSGGLAPGSYIESITLSKDLEPGQYPATATFTAYNKETLDEQGKAAAKVNLIVRN